MKDSFRVELPEEGDKLEIHLQGIKIKNGVAILDPLHIKVADIDIGKLLINYINDPDTIYLNTFISIKKKPVPIMVKCPNCNKINKFDDTEDNNVYWECSCGTTYNKKGEQKE